MLPIGAWKYNFLALKGNNYRPTDRRRTKKTDQPIRPTNQR